MFTRKNVDFAQQMDVNWMRYVSIKKERCFRSFYNRGPRLVLEMDSQSFSLGYIWSKQNLVLNEKNMNIELTVYGL